MIRRTKIIIFTDWYLPGYNAGGPIQSVANLVSHLKDTFEISIVTSNTDLGAAVPYPDMAFNTWINKVGYRVMYIDTAHQTISFYKTLLKEQTYDTIYLNSLFSVKFTLLPLYLCIQKPVRKVLAPRGMLGAGALAIKNHKKRIFLMVFKLLKWHKKIIWHATAELEANEIRAVFGLDTPVLVAPNLSSKMTKVPIEKAKAKGYLNAFFLSRIMSKKNLKFALHILKAVDTSYQITFTIIGNIEDARYWEECKLIMDTLPKNITIDYIGSVPHQNLYSTLVNQHLMLFPTHHENFGHVIIESWQCGAPVIISEHTPWKDLEKKQIGFDISLKDKYAFVRAVNSFAMMDASEFAVWSSAAFQYAKSFTENPELIEQNKALFLNSNNKDIS